MSNGQLFINICIARWPVRGGRGHEEVYRRRQDEERREVQVHRGSPWYVVINNNKNYILNYFSFLFLFRYYTLLEID